MTEQTKIPTEQHGLETSDAGSLSVLDRAIGLLPSIVYIYNQQSQSNEYSNQNIGEMMGYTPHEIRGFGSNLMSMLCHPEDLPDVIQHFKRISRLSDDETVSIEYRMRHKNGTWLWFLSKDTVFDRAPDGTVLRHLGAAVDITEVKLAEQRAVDATHAAEVANKDLRTFAYSISHDMKSPCNTLHLLLSELHHSHGSKLDPDAKQLIDKATETAASMRQRIERVIDYTRMIEGNFTFVPISLDEVVADVVQELRVDIDASQAVLDIEPLPYVSGSREELKILFQNLILNALRYHFEDKSPKIRIFNSSDPDENELRVTIVDEGIGIAPQNHKQIFEMFKRLHSEKQYSGSGLGLAICRRIAIAHGGDIFLKSQEGQGAAFTVQLQSPNHRWRRAES
ncbi:MAG: ATP-binding protein [Pseudomonadota bacterium]